MTDPTCPRAAALAAAVARRPLAADELAHARACDECAIELAIAASRPLARKLVASARLPDARRTLLRARLEARRRETERRLRPLVVWQTVVLVLASAVGLWIAPQLFHAPAAALPLPALIAGVAVLAALARLAAPRRRAT